MQTAVCFCFWHSKQQAGYCVFCRLFLYDALYSTVYYTVYCCQAVSIVSDLISHGRFDELEGLVTNEVCISSV